MTRHWNNKDYHKDRTYTYFQNENMVLKITLKSPTTLKQVTLKNPTTLKQLKPHWKALQKINHTDNFLLISPIFDCYCYSIMFSHYNPTETYWIFFSVTHILICPLNFQCYSDFLVWFSVSYSRSEFTDSIYVGADVTCWYPVLVDDFITY